MLCVVPTVTASKSKICGLALFFLETSCHVRCLSIVIFIQDVVPSGGACPKKSLWRRCSDFKKTWVSSKVQFALAWSTSGVTGAMNIATSRFASPGCQRVDPYPFRTPVNWIDNQTCHACCQCTTRCHVSWTLSLFHSLQKNNLTKTGIWKCMLDAYECMNKLGGDSQVVWCLISVENGGIISAINSHPTPPFPTKHQKCRNVRGDWWRFRNHVLFALFDRSRSVEWRNQSPLCDLVRPGEGKSKGTLP